MGDIVYRDENFRIIGACFHVDNEMGCGFLEAVYQECLTIEFARRGIPFSSQQEIPLNYQGQRLNQIYRADFICFEKIIVEIKAISAIADEHRAQIMNYLKATRYKLGLLVNFGEHPNLIHERFANTKSTRTKS